MKSARSRKIPKKSTRYLSLLRIFIFVFTIVLTTSDATDADLFDQETVSGNLLSATTLDFSTRHTANDQPQTFFFNTQGLLFGGFDVRSIRIKKDGQSNFTYQISSQKTLGDDNLYQNLYIEIMKDKHSVYQGLLSELNFSSQVTDIRDDLVIFLSLNEPSADLQNRTCDFNLIFKTDHQSVGFYDEEIIQNHVSSSAW